MMGAPVLAVFVPALMAVGILVSGAVVAAEWIAGLLPSRAVMRQQQITHDALGTVQRVANAVDADVSLFELPQREARTRRVYVVGAVVFAALGLLTVRFGIDLYLDPLSYLYDDEWLLVVGYGVGGVLIVLGIISLIPAAVSLQSAPVVRDLIQRTWLGKPVRPPDDPHELVTEPDRADARDAETEPP